MCFRNGTFYRTEFIHTVITEFKESECITVSIFNYKLTQGLSVIFKHETQNRYLNRFFYSSAFLLQSPLQRCLHGWVSL